MCPEIKALENRLQGSFNEILAKKGERAHLAPLVNLNSLTVEYTGGQKKT